MNLVSKLFCALKRAPHGVHWGNGWQKPVSPPEPSQRPSGLLPKPAKKIVLVPYDHVKKDGD